MGRKNLLKDMMGQGGDASSADKPEPHARPQTRAIGAVSKSIADLKSRSVAELDPFRIKAGGVQDRLAHDEGAHASLMTSIREHGQQVPVLVRPHPDEPDAYQIVYGRRRVLALRDLNMPVKAMIRDLDDRALVIAQGQENTARVDLSFIEKANFARQMKEAGYTGPAISAALHVDKTQISRMLSVAERIPLPLIEAIGPAPSVGRPRWIALALAMKAQDVDLETVFDMITVSGAETSDTRFDAALAYLERRAAKPRKPKPEAPDVIYGAGGEVLGHCHPHGTKKTLTLTSEPFTEWLIATLPDLHKTWQEKG
jgi:ParB family chromosome partitioning protein